MAILKNKMNKNTPRTHQLQLSQGEKLPRALPPTTWVKAHTCTPALGKGPGPAPPPGRAAIVPAPQTAVRPGRGSTGARRSATAMETEREDWARKQRAAQPCNTGSMPQREHINTGTEQANQQQALWRENLERERGRGRAKEREWRGWEEYGASGRIRNKSRDIATNARINTS